MQCAHNGGTGPLCIFSWLKRTESAFQAPVLLRIWLLLWWLDTFVRTHIYMKVSKRERKHGFSSYVNGKHISWTSRFFPGWSQLGRASPLHKTLRLNAIAEWIWGINPLELVDSDPYSKLDKTSERFLPGSEPKEWALGGQYAEGREVSSVCTQTARTQGLMEQSFWGRRDGLTFFFLGQIRLRKLFPPRMRRLELKRPPYWQCLKREICHCLWVTLLPAIWRTKYSKETT